MGIGFKMRWKQLKKSICPRAFHFLLLATVLSTSCVVAVVDDQNPRGAWFPRNAYQKTLALKSGGTLSLENTNGNISIRGWDEEKVELMAVEKRNPPLSPKIYFYGSHALEPKIDLQASKDGITIKTVSSGKEDEFRFVHYDLSVPRSIKLENIRNGQGDIQISDVFGGVQIGQKEGNITIKNFSGFVEIALGSGSVEVEVLDVRLEDYVQIKSEQGDISLYLEPGVMAQVEANAPNGNISSDFDLNQALPAKTVSAKLGEGKASLVLTALHGNISIRKVED
jgi:DUF4097 and DUF4098 domain-containing protein YvlB